MGLERVFGGLGVRELEAGRESGRVPIEKNKSPIQRERKSDVANPETTTWGYVSSASYKRQGSQSHNLKVETVIEHATFSKGSPIRLVSSRSDDFQLSSKCKKLSKNGNGCSKRPRLAQMEDSHGLDHGQMSKLRASYGGKRSDKRTAKILTRTKYDSFSPKNGMTNFNSSSGGQNVLGYYGLKPDLHDITKQVNGLSLTEHSLDELLDDTFACQDVGRSKGNGTSETNVKIVQSIKKVCSIYVSQRPSKLQASSELEGNLNKVVSAGFSSASCAPGSVMHDTGDSSMIDQFPQNKESCSCPESPASTLDIPLYHPSVVLERLGLQPSENLDSLLSGNARPPILSARDGFDSRLGKRLGTQPHLPAFPWSHTFGGHCKSTSDALKLSTSRSSCQGSRWAKIGLTACFRGVGSDDFTDFTKVSFNPNLVPWAELVPVNFSSGEAGHITDPIVLASSKTSNITLDDDSPSLTAAAQTLCDLATQPFPLDLGRLLRRPRKPQDKAVKAQKFKYEERSEKLFARPKLLLGYDSMARQTDRTIRAKKTKFTSTDKKKDGILVNGMVKGPLIWSGPKSCRSSSHRSVKDTRSENKYRSSDVSKPTMGLSPVRMFDGGSNSQQKPRNVVQVYWDR